MIDPLARPLELPCGQVLAGRVLKSAMSEGLGTEENGPSAALPRLYRRWAEAGLGLCITGNIMVDRRALGEPGNVVVEDGRHLAALRAWAEAGRGRGTAFWAQLNHPGKQAPRFLNAETVAPSAIGFGPAMAGAFPVPRALSEPEILEIIERFARSAEILAEAGFQGVQIHGAHGYLVSQFLSPHHNRRADDWGGSLENRARFAREILAALRRRLGPGFPIGIKLNSGDFQRGGFSEEECAQVIRWLESDGVDLIEVSGGTYEAPSMAGAGPSSEREGYFLRFVEGLRGQGLRVPLAVTGGFRSPGAVRAALETEGLAMVGLARPLVVEPELVARWIAGEEGTSRVRPRRTGIGAIDRRAMLEVLWYEVQLQRMGHGRDPDPDLGNLGTLLAALRNAGLQAFRRRRA